MAKSLLALALTSGLAFSFPLQAADFSQADALFAKRGAGWSEAVTAKEAYRSMVPSLGSDHDKIYAVTQMSRIDILVGGMMPGVDASKRNEMLDDCLANSNLIAHTKSQEYYYFYIACLAIRGKQATTVMERFKYGAKMRAIQSDALDSTRNPQGNLEGGFEGGGILRVISAVRSNAKAKVIPGMYNVNEAVDFAKLALETPKRMVPPFGEMSGREYFENYYYLASAELSLALENDDRASAEQSKQTADTAIAKIADMRDLGELPAGRDPEVLHYETELKGLAGLVTACLADSDWKACVTSKL